MDKHEQNFKESPPSPNPNSQNLNPNKTLVVMFALWILLLYHSWDALQSSWLEIPDANDLSRIYPESLPFCLAAPYASQ